VVVPAGPWSRRRGSGMLPPSTGSSRPSAYGGLRVGELAALRRSRVDFAGGIVDVAETVNELKGKPHGATEQRRNTVA
jgi:integrase